MKKPIKKLLSVCALIAILVVTCIPTVSAIEPRRIDFAAYVWVVSDAGEGLGESMGIDGHSFLIVENVSHSEITVGHYDLPVGETVTIGTFGNRDAHKGIWYNIEGYYERTEGYPSPYAAVTAVTGSELNTMNAAINGHDSWSLLDNCSEFAADVWNSIAPSYVELRGGDPATMVTDIINCDYYDGRADIPTKSISEIARQTSSGIVYDRSGAEGGSIS